MQESYEAPELKFIGGADEVVLGVSALGTDGDGMDIGMDFEFEQD